MLIIGQQYETKINLHIKQCCHFVIRVVKPLMHLVLALTDKSIIACDNWKRQLYIASFEWRSLIFEISEIFETMGIAKSKAERLLLLVDSYKILDYIYEKMYFAAHLFIYSRATLQSKRLCYVQI